MELGSCSSLRDYHRQRHRKTLAPNSPVQTTVQQPLKTVLMIMCSSRMKIIVTMMTTFYSCITVHLVKSILRMATMVIRTSLLMKSLVAAKRCLKSLLAIETCRDVNKLCQMIKLLKTTMVSSTEKTRVQKNELIRVNRRHQT